MSRIAAPSIWGVKVDSEQAAQMLSVREDHLRQLVRRGKISPCGRQGRRSLFFMTDVRRLADRRGVSRTP